MNNYRWIFQNLLNKQDFVPVDDRQKELTERYLMPYQEEIRHHFLQLRLSYDRYLYKNYRKVFNEAAKINWFSYPVWACTLINRWVYNILMRWTYWSAWKLKRLFRPFLKKWGFIKKGYWIQHWMYFENAMQAWDMFIDVSNDTVDKKKDKVVVCSMVDSWIRNIMTFEEESEINESYQAQNVYPNNIIPSLAPLFPKISIDRRWVLFIQKGTWIQARNVLSNFRLSRQFFGSRFWEKQLPHKAVDKLLESYNGVIGKVLKTMNQDEKDAFYGFNVGDIYPNWVNGENFWSYFDWVSTYASLDTDPKMCYDYVNLWLIISRIINELGIKI